MAYSKALYSSTRSFALILKLTASKLTPKIPVADLAADASC